MNGKDIVFKYPQMFEFRMSLTYYSYLVLFDFIKGANTSELNPIQTHSADFIH